MQTPSLRGVKAGRKVGPDRIPLELERLEGACVFRQLPDPGEFEGWGDGARSTHICSTTWRHESVECVGGLTFVKGCGQRVRRDVTAIFPAEAGDEKKASVGSCGTKFPCTHAACSFSCCAKEASCSALRGCPRRFAA